MKQRNKVYILRTCNPDMTSYDGFQWPIEGPVVATDWDPEPICGGGLHGLLKGCGDSYHLSLSPDAKWVVFSAYEDEVVDLKGKVKVPRGEVVLCGTQEETTSFLAKEYPGSPIVEVAVAVACEQIATSGYRGIAVAGNFGEATVGSYGTAVSGPFGRAVAEYMGTAITGNYGEAITENCGEAIAGNFGKATAGDNGTATTKSYGVSTSGRYGRSVSRDYGIANAGDYGTATAGDRGTANAGDYGIANAGRYGKAAAGQEGIIRLEYYLKKGTTQLEDKSSRYTGIITGYIGEDGLKPNVFYELDENHQFVEVQEMTGDSDETEE
jgi:hypothetical protein